MTVNQIDFENTVEKFRKVEYARGSLWDKARKLLLKGYEIEACILILATWNFAGFRYFLKNFDLDKFENIIKEINPFFNELRKETFECADFGNKNLQKNIEQIYSKLKEVVKQTGASKIMALKEPDLFVMWDTEIRKMYGINNKATPEDYIKFLEKMKDEFNGIRWQNKKRPFAKAIDEYNYVKAEERRNKKSKT